MRLSPKRGLSGLAAALCLLVACSPATDALPAPSVAPAPAAEAGSGPAAGGTLVGEWSPDRDLCSESRMTFTADGRHEALADDGEGWKVLAVGSYEQSGRQLSIRFEGTLQQREVVSMDEATLVLRHDDKDLAAVTGGYDVVLHRCPDRATAPPA